MVATIGQDTKLQVMELTDTNGTIHPIWFKYKKEQHIYKIPINDVLRAKKIFTRGREGILFTCCAEIDNSICTINLRLFYNPHRWEYAGLISQKAKQLKPVPLH